jgi:hypothetical protein
MFDLGSVPYKDSDELCIACVLSAHTLSVQKGSLRYPALFDFAAVVCTENLNADVVMMKSAEYRV